MSLTQSEPVTQAQECAHLIELYEGNAALIMNRIESQLAILASRAQTMLSLAGITITVTGFSGANIARSGHTAALLLVFGLFIVLCSAAITMGGILRVRWTTNLAPCTLQAAVTHALQMRDNKTRVYSAALAMLIVGLALYVSSVAMLLIGSVGP
jgi:hypothetical protein